MFKVQVQLQLNFLFGSVLAERTVERDWVQRVFGVHVVLHRPFANRLVLAVKALKDPSTSFNHHTRPKLVPRYIFYTSYKYKQALSVLVRQGHTNNNANDTFTYVHALEEILL